jgi:hypothetical protein
MTDSVLWVNYDAGNMKTRPHRERIFHHIQKNYRPQYKKQKAKALRTSVKIPGNSDHPHGDCNCNDEAGKNAQRRSFLPLKRLKGNSDPFDALPLPINAEENRIVAFYRDYMLPAAYNVDSVITRKILANAHAKAEWELCTTGLHDKGTALAFIASNAALVAIATNTPALQKKSLSLRSRSMAELRAKLTTERSSPLLWWHINMLWVAENAANNANAAQIHGTTLAKLMKEYFDAGGSLFTVLEKLKNRRVLELLLFFMYADMNMATQFLVRPCFDYYEWIQQIWQPFMQRVQAVALPAPEQPYPLDDIIDTDELRWCFDICREISARWRTRKTIKVPETIATMVMAAGQYKWDIALAKLVIRYCTHQEKCELEPDSSQRDYAQQYLSLAAIRWSRSDVQNDAYGRNLWVGKVMGSLRSVLDRSACRIGGSTWLKWQNARLCEFMS